jgi:hypothetical protein
MKMKKTKKIQIDFTTPSWYPVAKGQEGSGDE